MPRRGVCSENESGSESEAILQLYASGSDFESENETMPNIRKKSGPYGTRQGSKPDYYKVQHGREEPMATIEEEKGSLKSKQTPDKNSNNIDELKHKIDVMEEDIKQKNKSILSLKKKLKKLSQKIVH